MRFISFTHQPRHAFVSKSSYNFVFLSKKCFLLFKLNSHHYSQIRIYVYMYNYHFLKQKLDFFLFRKLFEKMNSKLMAEQIITDYYDHIARQIVSHTKQAINKYSEGILVDLICRKGVNQKDQENDINNDAIDIHNIDLDVGNIWEKTKTVFSDPFVNKSEHKNQNDIERNMICAGTRQIELIFQSSYELLAALRAQEQETTKRLSTLELDKNMSHEQIKRELFAEKSVFLIINRKHQSSHPLNPLSLHLVVLDLYLNKSQENFLGYFTKNRLIKY